MFSGKHCAIFDGLPKKKKNMPSTENLVGSVAIWFSISDKCDIPRTYISLEEMQYYINGIDHISIHLGSIFGFFHLVVLSNAFECIEPYNVNAANLCVVHCSNGVDCMISTTTNQNQLKTKS